VAHVLVSETPLRANLWAATDIIRRIVNTLALLFELAADQLISWYVCIMLCCARNLIVTCS